MPTRSELLQQLLAEAETHLGRRDLVAARNAYAAAVACVPSSIEAQARLADTCARHGDWSTAIRVWQRVLRQRPGLAVAHTGLALALRATGKLDEATEQFLRAATSNPTLPEAHFNLGNHWLAAGRPLDAVQAFRNALRLNPTYADARFNLALALLKAGEFKNGALTYEARWKSEWQGKERPFEGLRWNGRAVQDGPLLLWGEQGIGDEIMFAGLVRDAARTAGTQTFLECAPRLVPLFARSFPGLQVVARTQPPDPNLEAEAIHAPLGSLPGLLWPADSPPAAPAPYLQADDDTVTRMRARLAALGRGPKIGIAWRGGHPAAEHPRLIPAAAWRPLLGRSGTVAVSLQHGPAASEAAAVAQASGCTIHLLEDVDPLQDMDTFAALIAALDAVVAVDNSTVHLAGALGVPTAVLLATDSDWRWGVEGVACPWYRTAQRLRQTTPNDWAAPMQAADDFLRSLPRRA